MPHIDVFLDDVLEMTPVELGNHASTILTSQLLRQELLAGNIVSRKGFCDVLGIQESTLTRWLQGDSLPKIASVAYILLTTVKEARDEIYRLREKAGDCIVIAKTAGFAVCETEDADDGKMVARIVADDIPTLRQARRISAGISLKTAALLEDCEDFIEHRLSMVDDPSVERRLRSLSAQLSELRTVMVDFDGRKLERTRAVGSHSELIALLDSGPAGNKTETTGPSNEKEPPLHKLGAEIYGPPATKSHGYRDDIIKALLKFPMTYRAHRHDVFSLVEEIRKRRGAPIPRTFEDTVQRSFQNFCGDAAGFDKPEEFNLFCFPEGKWAGYWSLNEDNVRGYLQKALPASLDDIP